MGKEKYTLEYIFDKASRHSLWTRISTPTGLSEWFADEVDDVRENIFAFTWNKYTSEAEVIGLNPNIYIRFRWLEEEDPTVYFEFRLQKIELTGGLMLEITDFSEPEEKEEAIALWNTEVNALKRMLGI